MQTVDVRILYHAENDWSIWISGKLHSHVSSAALDDLIDYALVAVEVVLSETDTPSFGEARPLVHAPVDRLLAQSLGLPHHADHSLHTRTTAMERPTSNTKDQTTQRMRASLVSHSGSTN